MRLSGTKTSSISSGRGLGNLLWDLGGSRPSLDLRFAENKSLVDATTGASLVTFTRASSGTYVGSDGLIKTAATNEARFDHNPTTGESLGLLVEEQRTNLFLQSNGFDTTWANTSSTEAASAGTAPDGTNTAWLLTDNAANSNHNIFQLITWAPATYTFSVYAKYSTHQWIGVRIGGTFFGSWDIQNGAVGSATAGASISMKSLPNGWYRLVLTATVSTSFPSNLIISLNNADATTLTTYTGTGTAVLLWGSQLEAGAFPTSYIPTTTATVTRSADVASITGANFSSWYRQDEGTVFAEAGSPGNNNTIAALTDGSATNRILLDHGNNSRRILVTVSGVAQASVNVSYVYGVIAKSVGVYKLDNFQLCLSGTLGTPDTSGTVPTATQLNIGSNGLGQTQLGSTIKRLTYWPERLSNSTLQALTQ